MATYTWTTKDGMPTVETWDITPEFNTFSSEFGSGSIVRNSKWSNPRYRHKIKYRTPMRKSDVTAIKDFFIARKGKFESFLLNVPSIGETHTVMFTSDTSQFSYFYDTLSNFGEIEFLQEI